MLLLGGGDRGDGGGAFGGGASFAVPALSAYPGAEAERMVEAEEMAMQEDGDDDSEEEIEVIDIDEVVSGWGEGNEEEEAEKQAAALLPVPLPLPVATPRPAMTCSAQIARGADEPASPFLLPQQPPFSFTPATPPPMFSLSPAAGTVPALSLTDAAVAPATRVELTPVRAAVAAPLPPLMKNKKRAAAEAVATATMTAVAAAAVSSVAEAVRAMAAASEAVAAMKFASPPLRKKPRGRAPNGTNGLRMRWHGSKEAKAAVTPACDYCNSRGKVHRRCLRLPSCDVVWKRGKRRHDASTTAEATQATEAAEAAKAAEAEAAEVAQAEAAKAATIVEAKRQCAPTQSSASYKKSLLRRWVAEEPAAGSEATVKPAEVRQTDAAEAALRQAEAEGLTVQRCGSMTGFRNVQKTRSSKFQAIVWRQKRGGVQRVGLGTFSTAEEAALAYARTPEAQAKQVAGAGAAAAAAAAVVQVQAAASQCESKPRGTRGFNHFDEGGRYSLRTRPEAGYAFLEQTAEGEAEQDDGGGCFCGADDLQSVGITFNGMSHWSTFNDSWIQCDDCDRWCHSQCAGFDELSAEEAESYSCPTCLYAARSKPTKHVLSGKAVETAAAAAVAATAAAAAAAAETEAAAALCGWSRRR